MLNTDLRKMGERLLFFRKSIGKSQADVAEESHISTKAYAQIERGETNPKITTVLHICIALKISPDDLFYEEPSDEDNLQSIHDRLSTCTPRELRTASRLLNVFFSLRS